MHSGSVRLTHALFFTNRRDFSGAIRHFITTGRRQTAQAIRDAIAGEDFIRGSQGRLTLKHVSKRWTYL
jgi:hypothetical protein